jgi:transcriptional regulator with XRE-family HTH domain
VNATLDRLRTKISKRHRLVTKLQDREYRHLYVAANIRNGVAFQIRALRESRGWTQRDLGERTGMAQERISQLEDPDYGRVTLKTLLRLADAFDVSLAVRFEPFSSLVDWVTSVSQESLRVPSFADDRYLVAQPVEFRVFSTTEYAFPETRSSIASTSSIGLSTAGTANYLPTWKYQPLQDAAVYPLERADTVPGQIRRKREQRTESEHRQGE